MGVTPEGLTRNMKGTDMSRAKSESSKTMTTGQPGASDAVPLLLHPATEQALAAVGRVAEELEKLNVRMDMLIMAKGEKVRPAVEALAEQLISFLDSTGPDPDLEEDDPPGDGSADDEPSLGASEQMNQGRAWGKACGDRTDMEEQNEDGDELDRQEASDLEIYGEADSDNGGCVDDEPSLGSLDGRVSQKRWGLSDHEPWLGYVDVEHDEAEHEVSEEEVSEGGVEDMNHDPAA
jgi:hypothetical protein